MSEAIVIGIDDEVIELTGAAADKFREDLEAENAAAAARAAEVEAAKASILSRLGLTADELKTLLG
jgi:hypothetical protein